MISAVQLARAVRGTLKARKADPSISIAFTSLFVFIGALVMLMLGANAAGLGFERDSGPYIIGIFWQLALACVFFWRLLKFSDLPGGDSGDGRT